MEAGVGYLTHNLDLYDHLRSSLQNFTSLANGMLVISTLSLICSLWYFSQFFVSDGMINYRLIPLSVIFFGVSAVAFSAVRGILFLIQLILDRSRAVAQSARGKKISSLKGHAVRDYMRGMEGVLSTSVSLWWDAHTMSLRTVFVLIPGFLFYFLGLATLLAYALGLFMEFGG
ncbi:MAG: hypothetical protein LUO93_07060 [Methanomicrobiales archaeon]|nr:hypothetical protein [Methanomicrobiales archaeon]